jgi:hypothetical protein
MTDDRRPRSSSSLAFLRSVAHTDRRKDELLWKTPTTTTDDDARLPSLAFHRSVAHNDTHTERELLNYQASARTRTTLPGIVAQTHLAFAHLDYVPLVAFPEITTSLQPARCRLFKVSEPRSFGGV